MHIASPDGIAVKKAIDIIKGLTTEPEVGEFYMGVVRRIAEFGAFVEILPGTDGLVHISELDEKRVRAVQDVCKEGDEMLVKVIGIDRATGKIRLSRREAMGKIAGRGPQLPRRRVVGERHGRRRSRCRSRACRVRFRKLRPNAVTPRYMSEHAAGLDLASAADGPCALSRARGVGVPTGLGAGNPVGFEGQVRPRSGLALRAGVTVLNAPGTIDADYRGEVVVLLVNLGSGTIYNQFGRSNSAAGHCACDQRRIRGDDGALDNRSGRRRLRAHGLKKSSGRARVRRGSVSAIVGIDRSGSGTQRRRQWLLPVW